MEPTLPNPECEARSPSSVVGGPDMRSTHLMRATGGTTPQNRGRDRSNSQVQWKRVQKAGGNTAYGQQCDSSFPYAQLCPRSRENRSRALPPSEAKKKSRKYLACVCRGPGDLFRVWKSNERQSTIVFKGHKNH